MTSEPIVKLTQGGGFPVASPAPFFDDFDDFDGDLWYISDFTIEASWIQTNWNETYVQPVPGAVVLNFDGTDGDGKPFSGSEIQGGFYSYGTFEVEMIASDTSGVVSSFFLFTREFFGSDRKNEIDFEFLGDDTTAVQINYFYGDVSLDQTYDGSVIVPLGFDAADGYHTYTIEWQPDSIRWYAEGTLLFEITSKTAPIPIPDEPMKIYANIWTGGEGLESWHGPVAPDATGQASYSSVSYTPFVAADSTGAGTSISFAGHVEGLEIDLEAGTYGLAARIMAIGDSLTVGAIYGSDIPDTADGYRHDLFELSLANGGWFDYVGNLVNGPVDMLDREHAAVSGNTLNQIVTTAGGGASQFSLALDEQAPDIVLFHAGTNDYGNSGLQYILDVDIPRISADIAAAVAQFYAYAENAEKHLVISTIPPNARGGTDPTHFEYINEGYSIVGGAAVPGDAGNGTYVPGIAATVTSLQAVHPTLHLFRNPITEQSGMSLDLIHFKEVSHQAYGEALFALLEAEIGLTGGFGDAFALPGGVTEASGGEGGDRLGGSAGADILRGRGGNDYLEGGAGADILEGGTGKDLFAYGLDALDGTTDTVLDYNALEDDFVSLGAIIDSFGWSEAEIAANVTVTDGPDGAEIAIDTPFGSFTLARLPGAIAADVVIATTERTQIFAEPEEFIGLELDDEMYDLDVGRTILGLAGRDTIYGNGGDDILDGGAGVDKLWGGAGADIFRTGPDGLDGNLDRIQDFSLVEGDRLDVSPVGAAFGWSAAELMARLAFNDTANGDLRVSIDLGSGASSFLLILDMSRDAFLAADTLILDTLPPPDTGDDDGNLALTLPDPVVGPGEAGAVVVGLAGLDADATALVTLSRDGVVLAQTTAAADGDLVFDLTGIADGPLATAVTATDAAGNATTIDGPALTLATAPDLSADVDGNLAILPPDLAISDIEAAAVAFDVTGIDADATGVVTVTDGAGGSVAGAIAADGRIVLDLTPLADGALAATILVTDDAGNTATAAAAPMSLDQTTDTTADLDGNLAVAAPDTAIDASEAGAVVFDVTGIDPDATATVTVSDGGPAPVVSAPLAADGSVTLDLSGLADGPLGVTVTATDATGNTATATGPVVTLSADIPPDALVGTDANDTLTDDGDSTTILGLAGNDRLLGNAGDDILEGGDGNDLLRGDDGDDVLDGGAGRDRLRGQAGADKHVFGFDSLDGAIDTVDGFSGALEGDTVDMSGIAAGFGWSPGEAAGFVILSAHDNGVYLDLQSPEVNQRLADFSDVALGDMLIDYFQFA